jgi:dTDP-4-amino-4,6-dideoxygalactose transaminase
MTEFQAAVLRVQMSRLKEQNSIRAKNARIVTEGLRRIQEISSVGSEEPGLQGRVYHLYIFRYLKEAFGGVSKSAFVKALNAEGIPAMGGYPVPLYRQPVFTQRVARPGSHPLSGPRYSGSVDYEKIRLPNSEKACEEAIWLPQNVLLGDDEDSKDIIESVSKVAENIDELRRLDVNSE